MKKLILGLIVGLVLVVNVHVQNCTCKDTKQNYKDIEQIYKEWVETYQDFGVDPENPLYVKLLESPDGDLFFLKGLHHFKDPIRRLSQMALARLKTVRSFKVLVDELKSSDMFIRERSVWAIGDFKQPRCIPVLLKVLIQDPEVQLRKDAADALRDYKDDKVEDALLEAISDDDRVAVTAASALGHLGSEEAIQLTYDLIKKVEDNALREIAIGGLIQNKNKRVVNYLIKLLAEFLKRDDTWGKRLFSPVEAALVGYAKTTKKTLGPVPDTVEQWRDWWKKAEPLFKKNMQLKAKEKSIPEYSEEDFGSDPKKLTLSIAIDSDKYRSGDPIRLDIWMRNKSEKPYRTVSPRLPSGWYPTMAYGIHLKRLGKNPKNIITIEPSGLYIGSYCHPGFKLLGPRENFHDSICLQYFLQFQKIWPLREGSYELTISFDSSKFPGCKKPKKPKLVGYWVAESVEFIISGEPRTDPKDLLRVIGEKTGLKWIETDLTSRRVDRHELAWNTVNEYGDSRLLPFLKELTGKGDRDLHYYGCRSLRNFESFSKDKNHSDK